MLFSLEEKKIQSSAPSLPLGSAPSLPLSSAPPLPARIVGIYEITNELLLWNFCLLRIALQLSKHDSCILDNPLPVSTLFHFINLYFIHYLCFSLHMEVRYTALSHHCDLRGLKPTQACSASTCAQEAINWASLYFLCVAMHFEIYSPFFYLCV